jgi:nitrite reductase (NO-forming)
VQTTLVPAGGSAIVEFKLDTDGTYILVDHSIFRTFNKGSLGMLKVEGPGNKTVYSGKEVDETYLGDEVGRDVHQAAGPAKAAAAATKPDGKALFMTSCAMCHQAEGQGVPGAFPPVAKSDYLNTIANSKRQELVEIVLRGRTGKITVNGTEYNGVMTAVAGLDDEKLATLLTWVSNTWGNKAPAFTTDEVKKLREALPPVAPAVGGH